MNYNVSMERTLILPSHWLDLLAAGPGLARVSPEARLAGETGCKSRLAAKVTRFQHRSTVEIVRYLSAGSNDHRWRGGRKNRYKTAERRGRREEEV